MIFGQIEVVMFEVFLCGVVLDGVVLKGGIIVMNYSFDVWMNFGNWFIDYKNVYNQQLSVYDVYVKFFYYGIFISGGQV